MSLWQSVLWKGVHYGRVSSMEGCPLGNSVTMAGCPLWKSVHWGRITMEGCPLEKGVLHGMVSTIEGCPLWKVVSWGRVSTSRGCAVTDHCVTSSELDCVCSLQVEGSSALCLSRCHRMDGFHLSTHSLSGLEFAPCFLQWKASCQKH